MLGTADSPTKGPLLGQKKAKNILTWTRPDPQKIDEQTGPCQIITPEWPNMAPPWPLFFFWGVYLEANTWELVVDTPPYTPGKKT